MNKISYYASSLMLFIGIECVTQGWGVSVGWVTIAGGIMIALDAAVVALSKPTLKRSYFRCTRCGTVEAAPLVGPLRCSCCNLQTQDVNGHHIEILP
jgi:small neutral amino acid transporter SnatA (MarC family)